MRVAHIHLRVHDAIRVLTSELFRGRQVQVCAVHPYRRPALMTIAGLWPFLRERGFIREVHGAEARQLLRGKRVAIDVAFWAVQGDTIESATKRCQHFLLTSFWRVCRYLRAGALPIAVLDGPSGPSMKRRRRRPDGEYQRNVRLVKDLFATMGCPTLQANNEAEEFCAKLTTLGIADAIESADGDVFAFGASGLLLKSVGGDGSGAWSLEVVDTELVSTALGVGQQGWTAIAAMSGCDFLQYGVKGIGLERAVQCTRAMLRHCGGEASLSQFMLATLEDGLPDELRAYATLSGCRTCKRCGHGAVGKQSHGRLGCVQCGTAKSIGGPGGCKPRAPGPCPCRFHRNHDEVVLARTFSASESLPPASAVQRAWRTYEGTTSQPMNLTWSRINADLVAKLMSLQCGCSRKDTYRYLLPAMLLWDLTHPNNKDTEFKAVSVSGECVIGLADCERHEPSKKLAVLEWCALTGANVSGDLLRTLNEMPRAKRSVCKGTAMQFCPALVEAYCNTEFAKLLGRSRKARDELEEAARALYCDSWGFPNLPSSASTNLDNREANIDQGPKKKQRNLHSFFKSPRG